MKTIITNTQTLIKTMLIIVLLAFSLNASAKKSEKMIKYQQVTDKEVLIISNKGTKVLFTAYHNNSIGVSYFSKDEEVSLISPSKILTHNEFNGSIYVEEIDELMQITTTSNDGLLIKIDKSNFDFSFIDKTDKSELIPDLSLLVR